MLDCGLRQGAYSQNRGSRCTLPRENERFDTKSDGNRFKGGGWAVGSVRGEEGMFPPHRIRTLFSLLRPRDRLLRMYTVILAKSDCH